jgi:molecular chaperone Hsp33
MEDKIIKGIFTKANLRVAMVYATETAKTAESIHLAGETATRALTHGLISASLLSSTLKKNEKITLHFQWNGPLGGMLLEAGPDGNVRGFTFKKVLPKLDGSFSPLETAFGAAGTITVTRFTPDKVIYRGTVATLNRHIQQDVAGYLTFSEQTPSAMASAANYGENRIEFAGGFLIQAMPGTAKGIIERIRNEVRMEKTEANLLQTRDIPAVVQELVDDELLKIIEESPLHFTCDCSPDKIFTVLKQLSDEELNALMNEQGKAEITCHFCGKTYLVDKKLLEEVRKKT